MTGLLQPCAAGARGRWSTLKEAAEPKRDREVQQVKTIWRRWV